MSIKPKRKRASQADIAKRLGVSISTVSRALADSPSITLDIRRKVHERAIELGYPLRQRRDIENFDKIFIFSEIEFFNDTNSSIYQALLDGIREEAARYSENIEVIMTRPHTPIKDDVRAQIGPTTGVIFLGLSPAPETLKDFAEAGIAAVVANGVDEDLKLDSVSPTNFLGGTILARHLTDLGHRRFLYFGGRDRPTLQRRFAGSRQHIEGSDDWPDAKVVSAFKRDLSGPEEADRLRFDRWILRYREDVTALLCYNDGVAVWAMEAMKSLGISVPDDMSVVGFDDMPVARLTSPGLTTFRINWSEIGRESVQILHKRFSFPQAEVKMVQIGGRMIVRDSAKNITKIT